MKETLYSGLVIKSTGSWYTVLTPDDSIVQCRIKGIFRIKGIVTTNPVTVGDKIDFRISGDGKGMISHIHERKNYIIRRSTRFHKEAHLLAANIDQAIIMLSLKHPHTPREFIDRLLITGEAYHIPCILVINKTDLLNPADDQQMLREFLTTYELAGYTCIETSVVQNKNIDKVHKLFKSKLTLIAGNSGVGKSTLINIISPGLDLKTSEISDHHLAGKHTTTFSEIFRLDKDSYVIDSPGIKAFGLIDMDKSEIGLYFPEIFRISKYCRFTNCKHLNEPGCAVEEAVQKGEIGLSRYRSYCGIMLDDESKHR
jgi:ribosome biogenesis GTPase